MFIAEIDKVLPKLHPGTFNSRRSQIGFKSTVSLKLNTKTKWFDLPLKGEIIEMGEIAERVFKERFSEETYERLEGEYFYDSSDEENGNEDGQAGAQDNGEADTVDDIARGLSEVDIEPPDDWEDLASDSDSD